MGLGKFLGPLIVAPPGSPSLLRIHEINQPVAFNHQAILVFSTPGLLLKHVGEDHPNGMEQYTHTYMYMLYIYIYVCVLSYIILLSLIIYL